MFIIAGKSRHPGNWLTSLKGKKRRKAEKNDVTLPKPIQNQGNICLNDSLIFLVAVFPSLIKKGLP